MDKGICVIHANCQGEPLAHLLAAHPAFGAAYSVHAFVNYTRDHVPPELLGACDLFLYQHLEDKWGELASSRMLSGLKPSARAICVPNLFFKGYWPLWDTNQGITFSDTFLNALVDKGLSKKEIIHLYVYTDITRFKNTDLLFERSLERERAKERFWDIKLVDEVLVRFRQERLFNTVNHPNLALCSEVADGILRLLDMDPLDVAMLRDMEEPFGEFELPIHPQVAERLGLGFLDEHPVYNVYGAPVTFVEYVNYYVECRQLGERDLVAYMRLRMQERV